MSKKRTMSALGAALLTSVALATAIGPSAYAATPPIAPVASANVAEATSSNARVVPGAQVTATADGDVLSGTVSEDGEIYIIGPGSRVYGTVTTKDNAWSWNIPDKLGSGTFHVTVALFVDDVHYVSTELTFAYTQKVLATGPEGPITGSTATLAGTGPLLGTVSVTENGRDVAETNVVDGEWSVDVNDITVGTHTYTVRVTKGSTTVLRTVTVERQAPAVDQRLTIGEPADPSLGYTPNASFTFSGTAPLGVATVTVRNATGAAVAVLPVDATTGNWSWTRSNMGTSVYKLTFITDEGAAAEQKVVLPAFAPKKADPAILPIEFSNPSDPTVGYTANTAFTFRGTATPGATVSLQNASGVVFATDIAVGDDGTWSWTRTNMGTSIWKITAVATVPSGEERRVTLGDFSPAKQAAPVQPVTFTNPADPTVGFTPNTAFTFRGTATPGATVSLQNASGVVFATDIAVGDDGTWSWTRTNMGTSIWKVTAVATTPSGDERRATLGNFAPAKQASAIQPVTFTNPADPAAGYVANTGFTFRGTATPGAQIVLKNFTGTVIAQGIVAGADGTWSWTRANMGTSIWKLTAVADMATPDERSATLPAFAPQK